MTVEEAIYHRRSIRKFDQRPVDKSDLLRLVMLARLAASGGNRQPLRFAVVTDPSKVAALSRQLHWAMYLSDFKMTTEDLPPAYIVLLREECVCSQCQYEVGAASTTIFLAAEERGLSTCALGSFSAECLRELLDLPSLLLPELVIAVGYGAHKSRIVPYVDTVKYRQEEDGNFCVPKYSLSEVLVYED